jgi:hypothetical protein
VVQGDTDKEYGVFARNIVANHAAMERSGLPTPEVQIPQTIAEFERGIARSS